MASFKARIGWKRPRKKENKYCRSILFQPNAKQKIPKKEQKNYTIQLWLHFEPKQVEGGREREKIKINVSFRSNPVQNRKCQTKSKKIKNYRFVPFLPDVLQKIPKK